MSGWKMLNRLGPVLCAAFATIAFASQAGAVPLTPDLELFSGSGNLRFSNFLIYREGDIGFGDLADLDIEATENGIRIDGPLMLEDGAAGAVQVVYQVGVLSGPAVNGVTLSSVTSIVDVGFPTFSKTDKLIYEGPIGEIIGDNTLLAELRTRNFEGVDTDEDQADFLPQRVFTVLDTIRLSSGAPGASATFGEVANEFSFVPEPTTLLLLGGGLLGIAGLGSRRRA